MLGLALKKFVASAINMIPLKMELLAYPSLALTQLLKGTCFFSKVHADLQGSCQSTKIPMVFERFPVSKECAKTPLEFLRDVALRHGGYSLRAWNNYY